MSGYFRQQTKYREKNLDDHVTGEFLFVNTAKANEGLQYPGNTKSENLGMRKYKKVKTFG